MMQQVRSCHTARLSRHPDGRRGVSQRAVAGMGNPGPSAVGGPEEVPLFFW